MWNLIYAVPLGMVCGVVALVAVLCLAIGKQLGARTHAAFARVEGASSACS